MWGCIISKKQYKISSATAKYTVYNKTPPRLHGQIGKIFLLNITDQKVLIYRKYFSYNYITALSYVKLIQPD